MSEVKINPGAAPVNWLTPIREKPSDAGQPGAGGGDSRKERNDDPSQRAPTLEPEPVEATEEKVVEAIERFRSDSAAKASGLLAEKSGDGPGLKVVLKDVNGTVVRQFSGAEFLKLRETSSHDGRGRGRLLDRKY